ncbi:MAG TPA: class E sortase [Gaiellaceae bacterium]|nr:class E sortase [Gaiellaceae bacterium]
MIALARSSLARLVSVATPSRSRADAPSAQPADERVSRRLRRRRRVANALIVLGVVVVAYAGAIILWGDPATALYARWKQHQLSGQLDDLFSSYAARAASPAEDGNAQQVAERERRAVAAAARDFSGGVEEGQVLGRITIPKIGIEPVFVQGTRWAQDLSRGPGHYPQTPLPGLGKTTAIAAHRTTFGAWFRHVDDLKAGDRIVLKLPYATFSYRVFGHKIVASDDWRIIRPRGFDALVLSSCHPLYSASHRWIVYAALYRVDPVKGKPYLVDMRNEVRLLKS